MARVREKRSRGAIGSVIELVLTVAVAIGLALLIQAFIVKPYRIPSGSMVPTLDIGQRILVNRLITHPALGDVVVFHPPAGADPETPVCGDPNQGTGEDQACDEPTRKESAQTFVKRVVGLPGDRISIVARTRLPQRRRGEGLVHEVLPCGPENCNFPRRSSFRPATTS
jgi:signal peptidase I